MFSGVFYISVDGAGALQTKDKSAGTISVQTGDIILFPSFLEHRVAPNQNKTKRIVIAFNVNFDKV
jgi:cupin superfamily acireductone dioxygenase involved in methionine salvage